MASLVRVIKREVYNLYYNRPHPMEPIFDLFLSEPDRSYVMRTISAKTGVRTTTLYFWRERVRADPTRRPSRDLFSENRRIFPDDVKQTIVQFIQVNFLAQGSAS
jgi:transposase-like protein